MSLIVNPPVILPVTPPINKLGGWLPDPPDYRDWKFEDTYPLHWWEVLPSLIDLRNIQSSIENQTGTNSCVAQAVIGAVECLEFKKSKLDKFVDYSRLFNYWCARYSLYGMNVSDSGCFIRDAVRDVNIFGICNETSWPFDISKINIMPAKEIFELALKHKLLEYYRINDIKHMKKCLTDGYPFVFGYSVWKSQFEGDNYAMGNIPMPGSIENDVRWGSHAVLAVGYDDNTKKIIIKNSWGNAFGSSFEWNGIKSPGYGQIPYEMMTPGTHINDIWTLRLINDI